MAYKNNNNRVTPENVTRLNLQPAANPVNKEIQYKPDYSKTQQLTDLASSLQNLSTGVQKYDTYLQRIAQDKAIEAMAQTEAEGGNKKEWADVSSRVAGMAQFNPYIKESFRTLSAQDIYRNAVIELNTKENMEKMSTDEYNAFVMNTKQKMYDSFKQLNLSPANYADVANKFETDISNQTIKYTTANNKYTHELATNKQVSDLTYKMNVMYSASKTEDGRAFAIKNNINEKIAELSKLGFPEDEIANIVASGLQNFALTTSNNVNSATVSAAFNDIKINGKKMSDFIPDFDYKVDKMVKQIKQDAYSNRLMEYNDNQLTIKQNTDKANAEFFDWWKDNQGNDQGALDKALELTSKYGIESEGSSFLSMVASTKNYLKSITSSDSDEAIYNDMAARSFLGTLTPTEIATAVQEGKIKPDDAFKLRAKLESDERDQNTEFTKQFKQIQINYANKTGAYGKQLNQSQRDDVNKYIVKIQEDVSNGNITPLQGIQLLQKTQNIIRAKTYQTQQKNNNYQLLLNGKNRETEFIPETNIAMETNAIKRMAILRNSTGVRDNTVSILSPRTNRRQTPIFNSKGVVTGYKTQRHLGLDLNTSTGIRKGRNVYPPSDGEVVSSGNGGTMGYYALFRNNKTGKFVLYQHLNSYQPTGKISRNTPIGTIGTSGNVRVSNSANGCLHVEFWDADCNIIRADQW